MNTKTITSTLAALAVCAAGAVGAAAPANAGGNTVIKTGVTAGAGTVIKTGTDIAAWPNRTVEHSVLSDLPTIGVLQNWPYGNYLQVGTTYAQVKKSGAAPWLLARGNRTPIAQDIKGVFIPTGYWLARVGPGGSMKYVADGGTKGVARQLRVPGEWANYALCKAGKTGQQCRAS